VTIVGILTVVTIFLSFHPRFAGRETVYLHDFARLNHARRQFSPELFR
jgi:hypothetical protein